MPTDLDELDKMDPQQLAKIIQKLPSRNVLDPGEAVSTSFSVIADHLPPREKLQTLEQAVDAHRDGAPFFSSCVEACSVCSEVGAVQALRFNEER